MKEKILEQSNDNFDWTLYDNGYCGGNSLYVNKSVKVRNKHDKVYCHESYAQELYDMICDHMSGHKTNVQKDLLRNAVYEIVDIHAVSDHEVSVDTAGGMSSVIDLNKEKQYLDTLNCSSVTAFVNAIKNAEAKAAVLKAAPLGKVMNGGRVSLWEGHLSKIKAEFMDQIKNPDATPYAYYAKIEEINGGGYIVDIQGVKCFLPGSLAAAGILTDFNVLMGKTIPVMLVNYVPNSGFVVSYKKYLNTILPTKIENELSVGQAVFCKVTGTSKNGVFMQFRDNTGEWLFSGLIHRTSMSEDFEKRFDSREFRQGDEMRCFIHAINKMENSDNYRIVLGDMPPKEEKKSETAE